MKTSFKLKTILLSLGVAVMTLTATKLNAQNDGSRGLFGWGKASNDIEDYGRGLLNGSGESFYVFNLNNQQFGSDENGGYNLYNQSFEEVPMGSGLLILTAVGVGYALKKRKSNIKTHKS